MGSSREFTESKKLQLASESALQAIRNRAEFIEATEALAVFEAYGELRREIDRIPLTKHQRVTLEELLSTISLAFQNHAT